MALAAVLFTTLAYVAGLIFLRLEQAETESDGSWYALDDYEASVERALDYLKRGSDRDARHELERLRERYE